MTERREHNTQEESPAWKKEAFFAAFHSSPIAQTIAHLPLGKWVEVNEAFLRLIQYSRDEVIGKTSAELHIIDSNERERLLKKVQNGEAQQNEEVVVSTKFGKNIIVLYSLTKFEYDGETYAITTLIDISERKAKEDALHYNASLVEHMFDAAISTDKNHNIVSWNSGAERMYGWKSEEILGRSGPILNTTFINTNRENVLSDLHKNGFWSGEVTQTTKAGQDIYVSSSLRELKNDQGSMVGTIVINRDITSQKHAENALHESENRYRTIVETSGEGILISDLFGRFTFVNQRMAEMLGYAVDEILGKTTLDFVADPELIKSGIWKQRDELREGSLLRAEIKYIRKDGSTLWCIYNASAVFNPKGIHVENYAMLTDITALKEDEEAKNKFIAILAHELRNPMAVVMSSLELSELYAASLSEPEVSKLSVPLHAAHRQLENMKRILEDLLDVSRIVYGKFVLKKVSVDIRTAILHAASTTQMIFDNKQQTLEVELPEEPLPILADRIPLEQIIINLLENAAKYTQEFGLIRISALHEDNEVVVRVKDDGVGISPDKLTLIFQPFFQAERREKESRGGLGIGLMLVQELTKLHHGHVSVVSGGVGQGSEFILRFPIVT